MSACDLTDISHVLSIDHDLLQLCLQWGLKETSLLLRNFEKLLIAVYADDDACDNDYVTDHIFRQPTEMLDKITKLKEFTTLPGRKQAEIIFGLKEIRAKTAFGHTGYFKPLTSLNMPKNQIFHNSQLVKFLC